MSAAGAVTPSAARLHDRLAAAGHRCTVEARERLAVLVPAAPADLATLAAAAVRPDVVRMARECGFTHVALELPDEPPPGGAAAR